MPKTTRDGAPTAEALDKAIAAMHAGSVVAPTSVQMAAYLADLETEIANRRSELLIQAKVELRQREELVDALGGTRKPKRGRPTGSRNKPKAEGAGA